MKIEVGKETTTLVLSKREREALSWALREARQGNEVAIEEGDLDKRESHNLSTAIKLENLLQELVTKGEKRMEQKVTHVVVDRSVGSPQALVVLRTYNVPNDELILDIDRCGSACLTLDKAEAAVLGSALVAFAGPDSAGAGVLFDAVEELKRIAAGVDGTGTERKIQGVIKFLEQKR